MIFHKSQMILNKTTSKAGSPCLKVLISVLMEKALMEFKSREENTLTGDLAIFLFLF